MMVILYCAGWILYYAGIAEPAIVLDLSVAPCMAFILFSLARKNVMALIPAIAFMICHVIYGVINFVI